MMNKKGAIELSMTTIIVVVIGVTLLSLGLFWVRGMFENLEGISGDAFDHARDAIDQIGQANEPLTISPSQITLEPKKNDAIGVIVANLESGGGDVSVTLYAETSDTGLLCGFPDGETLVPSVGPTTITSGDQISEILGIIDKSGSIRPTSCKIRVDGLAVSDNTETLVINIEA